MKKLFAVLIMAVAMLSTTQVSAQDTTSKAEQQKAQREALMKVRLEVTQQEVGLTAEQMKAFEPVYREFRKDLQRVADAKVNRIKKDQISNDNAIEVLSGRLANEITTTAVKQQYLWRFAAVIEPMQIMTLYKVDDKISKKARDIMKAREGVK